MFCQNGDIRLVNGTSRYEGRVELCYDEIWGTICDGLWSANDANVACRQLGFADNGMIKQAVSTNVLTAYLSCDYLEVIRKK